eukprot:TRINITY_DN5254_c0_g2_i17.p2 TRINITY_DN5254_c0_g2~~TRINITY_DN5254_c0_g2_i17.p2  ORF type:complete len:128 (+),score=37.23 TRINITY_DN5254_c0_g2_i17:65-448(+)
MCIRDRYQRRVHGEVIKKRNSGAPNSISKNQKMDDMQSNDEMAFSSEEVEKFIIEAIEKSLNNTPYDESKVPHWINAICETLMAKLIDTSKPFKYMINCMIMQRNGCLLYTSPSPRDGLLSRMPSSA